MCSYNEHTEPVSSTKRRVENLEKDDLKKSRVEERSEEVEKSEEETQHREGAAKVEPEKPEEGRKQRELMPEEYIIGRILQHSHQWLFIWTVLSQSFLLIALSSRLFTSSSSTL